MSLDTELLEKIDFKKLPRHIAIIMDGNGRWAKKRNLPRFAGHKAGIDAVNDVVTNCRELGIKALTLYCFSIENWMRPKDEVDFLMNLLIEYIYKELPRIERENIRFNVIGRILDLSEFVKEAIRFAMDKTFMNDAMILTLALSYGSRTEILQAAKEVSRKVLNRELSLDDINESILESCLDTSSLPELDLIIRTSGELRLSNFLLWQAAYAELYFTDILWPDFKGNDLLEAIITFQNRERRFGLTSEQIIINRKNST